MNKIKFCILTLFVGICYNYPLIFAQDIQVDETTQNVNYKEISDKDFDNYIKLLKENGTQFDQKLEYLDDKTVKKEIRNAINTSLNKDNEVNIEETEILDSSYNKDEVILDTITQNIDSLKEQNISVYIVQPGDTIENICKAMNYELTDLVDLNQLKTKKDLESTFNKNNKYPKLINAELNYQIDNFKDVESSYPLYVGDLLFGIIDETEESSTSESNLINTKDEAINFINNNQFSISQDQINKYIEKINIAANIDEVNNILNEIKGYLKIDNINNGQTTTISTLESDKNQAINMLLGMNINQEQYNSIVAEINKAQDSQSLQKVMEWAQNLANENTTVITIDISSNKAAAKQVVASLNITSEQLTEVNTMIDNATTVGEVDAAVVYANQLVQP